MKVAIASDHRGYHAKEHVKQVLTQMGHDITDFGTHSDRSKDYPDFALPVCNAVHQGDAERGILMCGSGIGMCMTANKVPGIRAALCHDELTAEMSRRHNNANVLCLPADLIGEELTRRIVEVWLKTDFEGGRHARRVRKISGYEDQEAECPEDKPAPKSKHKA